MQAVLRLAAAALAALSCWSVAAPARAQSSFLLGLDIAGDAERRVVRYDCGEAPGESFDVQYINAAPNFLAFVPVSGETYLFASVISASGAKPRMPQAGSAAAITPAQCEPCPSISTFQVERSTFLLTTS